MLDKELIDYIDWQDGKLRSMHGNYDDKHKRALARTVKLGEESGELAEAVLAWCSFQRNEKMKKKAMNLSDEIADVIITALLIAKTTGIDSERALCEKIAIIKERFKEKQ